MGDLTDMMNAQGSGVMELLMYFLGGGVCGAIFFYVGYVTANARWIIATRRKEPKPGPYDRPDTPEVDTSTNL